MIASEGELKASRALKEAADVIQESPSALQVEPADPERFYTDPDPTFYVNTGPDSEEKGGEGGQ